MLSLLLRALAGWRPALLLRPSGPPRQKGRASAMSEGGRGHVARAVRAGAGGRRLRRSPALVLSAKRGAGATVSVFMIPRATGRIGFPGGRCRGQQDGGRWA